ncbi:MAG: hypothetical protein NXI01_01845 [Gammaproteobacteria bacterium]|nr:hypothetical protein [Gammaproteobacteria bacterium]
MPEFSPEQQTIITTLRNYGTALNDVYDKHHARLSTDDTAWDAVFVLQFMIDHNRRLITLLQTPSVDEQSLLVFGALLATIKTDPEHQSNAFLQELHWTILAKQPWDTLLRFYEDALNAPSTTNERVWKILALGLPACLIFTMAYAAFIALVLFVKATITVALLNMLLLPLFIPLTFIGIFALCLLFYPEQCTRSQYQRAHDSMQQGLDSVNELHTVPYKRSITATIEKNIGEETQDETKRTKTRVLNPADLYGAFFNGSLSEEVEKSYCSLALSS